MVTVRNQRQVVVPKVCGTNSRGEMAFALWENGTAIARGLLENGGSCIFQGSFINCILMPSHIIISPTIRPVTEQGEEVLGYEDPTPLRPENNFFEPCKWGMLVTEAYRSKRTDSVETNLLYIGETGYTKAVLTPKKAMDLGLQDIYSSLDMVKEAEVFSISPFPDQLLIEVGANSKSRLAVVRFIGGEAKHVRPFLNPCAGTWYSDHVSTASPLLALDTTTGLIILNGRDDTTWRVGTAIVKSGEIVEVQKPFLNPPDDTASGPGGQKIAFASFYDPTEKVLYYHLQDTHIMQCNCNIVI